MCMCMYIYIYVCVCLHTYIHTYVCTYIQMHVMHVCMHVCMYVCVHASYNGEAYPWFSSLRRRSRENGVKEFLYPMAPAHPRTNPHPKT